MILMLSAGVVRANCENCHVAQGGANVHVAVACTLCHAGQPTAAGKDVSHRGLIVFPGDMGSAARACGGCHADKVASVGKSLMNTGVGMIATTRRAYGESVDRPGHNDLDHLTQSPADSLLRKQCASCHLSHKKTRHRLDATSDRGGGCLACHINEQSSHKHPVLTARVSDARCFGCHSRSGRISLNYVGLAEAVVGARNTRRLEDGRRVESRPDDRHHAAGMGCIDCHTERDLMGVGVDPAPLSAKQAVDIACGDCHQIRHTISWGQWPKAYRNQLSHIPYRSHAGSRFPVTASGTPLWNVELRGAQAWLYRKDGRGALPIPPYSASRHPWEKQHARLSCSACHSQWVPQCYGCHMEFDASQTQFDHIVGHDTPGRWNSQQSGVRNGLPPLGVLNDRVVPVLPGMIMTVTHPSWSRPLFTRRFQSIEPHTTGAARSCASCHRDSSALGLGEGLIERWAQGGLILHPAHPVLADGLPADAWTSLAASPKQTGALRPFTRKEMERIVLPSR